MALIKCPECGKEVSSSAQQCPHCGFSLQVNDTVTILGYTETFATNPSVSIYQGETLMGTVERNEKVEFSITSPVELTFKCSFRSAKCMVSPGDWVLLSFNRTSGSLSATKSNKENYALDMNKIKGKDSSRKIWIIILSIAAILLGILINSSL